MPLRVTLPRYMPPLASLDRASTLFPPSPTAVIIGENYLSAPFILAPTRPSMSKLAAVEALQNVTSRSDG